ncbi:hypothetical protein KC349_g46 [Hortaea werneckii]|nr:hypothetical protein KC349_g46 [Hortaea werneckii]
MSKLRSVLWMRSPCAPRRAKVSRPVISACSAIRRAFRRRWTSSLLISLVSPLMAATSCSSCSSSVISGAPPVGITWVSCLRALRPASVPMAEHCFHRRRTDCFHSHSSDCPHQSDTLVQIHRTLQKVQSFSRIYWGRKEQRRMAEGSKVRLLGSSCCRTCWALFEAYVFPLDGGAAAYGFEADGAGEAGLSFLPPNSRDLLDSSPSASTFFLPQPIFTSGRIWLRQSMRDVAMRAKPRLRVDPEGNRDPETLRHQPHLHDRLQNWRSFAVASTHPFGQQESSVTVTRVCFATSAP